MENDLMSFTSGRDACARDELSVMSVFNFSQNNVGRIILQIIS